MNDAFKQFLVSVKQALDYPFLTVGGGDVSLAAILKLLLLFGLVLFAEYLLRRYLTMRLLKRTPFHPPLQYAIARITGYLFILLGFYIALMAVGVNLSSLAVVAGAVGVGIGFGLQNIVHNFVSGIIILAEQPIALGDRIEVGGVAGRVARIRLRSTEVITNDNISIIVPNSDIITHPVTNWSHGDLRVRIRIPIGVAYGTDVERLRKLLLEVAEENLKVLKSPEPAVYFESFGDSALLFELGVWTSEMTHSPRRFRSELNFAIERKLRENNIQIPFPQRDLHLRSGTFVLQTNAAETQDSRSGTIP
jgi:small-conductance mechanosensitive channel